MTCNVDNLIASIIRMMGSDSPCDDSLADVVHALWELVGQESCGSTELRALYTRREVVLYLMGCEAYSVDSYDRHRLLSGNTVADSRSDVRTQAQSTGNSTKFSTGHGETKYDEASRARSNGEMDRHALGTEVGDGVSFYRDDGKGNGYNNSQSTNKIQMSDSSTSINSLIANSEENGYRTDCNYEYSTTNTNGQSAGIMPLAVFSFSGGGSEWRKFTKTRANDRDVHTRQTKHDYSRNQLDDRRSQGTHDWLSQFLADIFWRDTDVDVKVVHDRSDTRRHSEAHAQGSGDGFHEEKAEAHNSAQGTAKSEASNATKRTLRRSDTMSTVQLANSQRFSNLRRLYDQLTEQVEHARKRLRARAPALISVLPCNCQGCCHCGPTLRNIGYGLVSHSSTNAGGLGVLWSA